MSQSALMYFSLFPHTDNQEFLTGIKPVGLISVITGKNFWTALVNNLSIDKLDNYLEVVLEILLIIYLKGALGRTRGILLITHHHPHPIIGTHLTTQHTTKLQFMIEYIILKPYNSDTSFIFLT